MHEGIDILTDLLTLVGQIYDAALDPAQWNGVLGAVAAFVDAARATLFLEDAADPMRSVLYTSLSEPEWAARYVETFILMGPGRKTGYGGSAVVTVAGNDSPPRISNRKAPFLREFLRGRNMVDTAVAAFGRTAQTITVLSLQHRASEDCANVGLRQKLDLLIPHIERAAAISLTLDRRAANADSLADALDKVAAGVFLLSDSCEVVHANAAARQLVDQRAVVRLTRNRLIPTDPAARAVLAGALAAARSDCADRAGVTIAFTREEPGLVGTLLPLTTASRDTNALHHRAVAVLCVRPAELETTPAAGFFAQRYRLTPRELSVLVAIVEQGGIPETAAALRLTEGTVKGYLKAIFQKTGAHRQADLVRMVAGFASPFH